ncbi:NAD(P)-dependent dehydrogenase, short-chain alcohol dehydrogenase family [Sphingopyxis sp. YR583]|uniref:SDR family NAD(P)-dependent oxidoreductase n=1 Tax=Sphingopyxis sp. YR583 TaxID=1881047 RepID=UPI0008A7E483|nr:SDR family oxidoreductase [Sphingopyxis sp. YR583]SEH19185.1 NAD(P)-dependent dehydrogenase, short-chain alcohol dehydrogenase family [Sphingopyxis sp. YR583]
MELEDWKVLITGAGSGIGRAGAERFAHEGAKVAVMDSDLERAIQTADLIVARGGHAVPIGGDLAEDGVSERVVATAAAELGGLDALWCNAGIMGPTEIEDIDGDAYATAVAVNMTSPILSCAAALPHLRRSRHGAILITASTSGLVGAMSGAIYTATKFAVVGYVKSLAQRVAADAIRVNALCPGPVLTPLMQRLLDQGSNSMTGDEYRARVLAGVPLNRFARPEEIADAALWLASPRASYVTGIALPVDGGYTCR